MRRGIATILGVMVGVAGLVAIAGALTCTVFGTQDNDVRVGNAGPNVMCLRRGNDYGHGKGGPDRVRGAAGNDTLIGGSGRDILRGRGDNDRLFVVDGQGGDIAYGGPGNDKCYGERRDRYVSCEQVHVGNSYPKSVVLALVTALGGSIKLGQAAQLDIIDICAAHPAPPPMCGQVGK